MTDQTNPKQTLSRRDALKTLAAATGATALSALPNQWETPLVEMGALPAFAQVSGQPGRPTSTPLPTPGPTATLAPPVEYPFTSTVQVDGVVPPEENGWIAVNVNNGETTPLIPTGISSNQAAVIIVRPPIQRNKRKFTIIAPTWTFKRTIKISYTFTSVTQVIPADGTELICYGISGDTKFEATIKAVVVGGVVVIDYPLPATFTGLFYFSTNFVQTSITLTNSVTVDIRRYFAVGIYAELTKFNEVPTNPPLLLGGNIFTHALNTPICNFGDGGKNGSQIRVEANYTGGNMSLQKSRFNVLVIFYPSGRAFLFPSQIFQLSSTFVSTIDICLRFAGSTVFYFAVSITDDNGNYSNSLSNFFIPPDGANIEDGVPPMVKKIF